MSPAPTGGQYPGGVLVQFCYNVSAWNQTGSNWLHGVIPTFGPGWDTSTLAPLGQPPSLDSLGVWLWQNNVTGLNTGTTFTDYGWFYDSPLGGPLDGNPGNNFGDDGLAPWTFCFQIQTNAGFDCIDSSDLSVTINTLADSESGAWTTSACNTDPVYTFAANLDCCTSSMGTVSADFCADELPIVIVGTPPGGILAGAGVSGSVFDPGAAGPGSHVLTYFGPQAGGQGYTIVQSGTFAPISGTGSPVVLGIDDVSGALPVGFPFEFFGISYNFFYISSNGFITFDNSGAHGCCSGQSLPNASPPNNLIAFAWEDLNPILGSASINYATVGTAPSRICAINFVDVQHFNGGAGGFPVTTQIKLFESSNYIEIHTTSMPSDGGNHTMGLEDTSGNLAFFVPGRNSTNWSATNDFVQFIPDGCGGPVQVTVTVTAPPIVTIDPVNPGYCLTGSAVALTANPSGGVFIGPGVVGGQFNPVSAGVGTHQIDYIVQPSGYQVDQSGTFNPIAGTGTFLTVGDDQVTAGLPIGFNFYFFDLPYNSFRIGSNGFITFSPNQYHGCCSGQNIPNSNTPNNLIAFAWEDLRPPAGGTIDYFTTGTGPARICVINFTAIPHFSNSNPITTQIQLRETSNKIEIHTTIMPSDGGSHTMGIENIDGTIAYPVPGRNASNWSATNDYVAFCPVGGCPGSDQITVNVGSVIVTNAVPTDESCSPGADGSIDVSVASGTAPYSYSWSTGDTVEDLTGLAAGNYSVTVTDAYGCNDVVFVSIAQGNPGGTPGIWLWTGDKDDDWFEACNWDKLTVPNAASIVIIPGSTTFNPKVNSGVANAFNITINSDNGANLEVNSANGAILNVIQ